MHAKLVQNAAPKQKAMHQTVDTYARIAAHSCAARTAWSSNSTTGCIMTDEHNTSNGSANGGAAHAAAGAQCECDYCGRLGGFEVQNTRACGGGVEAAVDETLMNVKT